MKYAEILKKQIDTGNVVSIYTNTSDPYKCTVGFVEFISDEYVIQEHIGKCGLYDGYVLRSVSDIFQVILCGGIICVQII